MYFPSRARPNPPPVSPRSTGKTAETTDMKFTCCVLWLSDINASRCSDEQQTAFFAASGKRRRLRDETGSRSRYMRPSSCKQGETTGAEGGRKWEEREDRTGLHSSVDTPYNDVEWERVFLYFPHKEIISASTVYCLQSGSQMAHSCCSLSLLCMHFNFWLFLAVSVQIFAL